MANARKVHGAFSYLAKIMETVFCADSYEIVAMCAVVIVFKPIAFASFEPAGTFGKLNKHVTSLTSICILDFFLLAADVRHRLS